MGSEKREVTADTLRALGWSVAVHNDYKLDGVSYTFWLFTKGDLCAKGEGLTDLVALAAAGNEILRLEGWEPPQRDAYFQSREGPGSYGHCWKRLGDENRGFSNCILEPGHKGECGHG